MNYQALYDQARAAGLAASAAVNPRPMVVLGGSERYVVPDGVCGFAWVNVSGASAFGRWAKKALRAGKGYPSGRSIWVSDFNQSMARKEAYARAYADVLRAAGVAAYPDSRMD